MLPLRYEDRTRVSMIGALVAGNRAAVEGEIQLTEVAYRGRRQLLCRISDGSGMLTLRFFYFSSSQQHTWRAARACAASARCAAARSGWRSCTRSIDASRRRPRRSRRRSRRSTR